MFILNSYNHGNMGASLEDTLIKKCSLNKARILTKLKNTSFLYNVMASAHVKISKWVLNVIVLLKKEDKIIVQYFQKHILIVSIMLHPIIIPT